MDVARGDGKSLPGIGRFRSGLSLQANGSKRFDSIVFSSCSVLPDTLRSGEL